MRTVPNHPTTENIVDAALSTLRLFGPEVSRDDAAILVSMWSRRAELTPEDRLAVLDAFGPAPAFPTHTGFRVGSRVGAR